MGFPQHHAVNKGPGVLEVLFRESLKPWATVQNSTPTKTSVGWGDSLVWSRWGLLFLRGLENGKMPQHRGHIDYLYFAHLSISLFIHSFVSSFNRH